MGSHSVTCHPTQVSTPRLNPSRTGRYSIYLPQRDGRLSWPRWLVTYRDDLPAHRWSPIQVLTGPVSINYVDRSLRANHYTMPPWVKCSSTRCSIFENMQHITQPVTTDSFLVTESRTVINLIHSIDIDVHVSGSFWDVSESRHIFSQI